MGGAPPMAPSCRDRRVLGENVEGNLATQNLGPAIFVTLEPRAICLRSLGGNSTDVHGFPGLSPSTCDFSKHRLNTGGFPRNKDVGSENGAALSNDSTEAASEISRDKPWFSLPLRSIDRFD